MEINHAMQKHTMMRNTANTSRRDQADGAMALRVGEPRGVR